MPGGWGFADVRQTSSLTSLSSASAHARSRRRSCGALLLGRVPPSAKADAAGRQGARIALRLRLHGRPRLVGTNLVVTGPVGSTAGVVGRPGPAVPVAQFCHPFCHPTGFHGGFPGQVGRLSVAPQVAWNKRLVLVGPFGGKWGNLAGSSYESPALPLSYPGKPTQTGTTCTPIPSLPRTDSSARFVTVQSRLALTCANDP